MTEKKQIHQSSKKRRLLAAMLGIVFVGTAFVWWTIYRVDRELHAGLLQKVRLVAQAIDIKRVKTLTGSDADLTNPNYLKFKEQFAAVKQADEKCRFVYLMGQKPDGTLFFFVDNEPPDSEDYSPPGQTYEEASPDNYIPFTHKIPSTQRPHTDRWGTWVTGFVPILDPSNGELLAVLGMDVDASVWKWDLIANAAMPVGMMLVLLIVVITAYFSTSQVAPSPRPVLRRLMIPLAIVLFLLVAGSGTLLVIQQTNRLNETSRQVLQNVSADLRLTLYEQSLSLSAIEDFLVQDDGLREALKTKDRNRLLADYLPILQRLKSTNNITHLTFLTPDRICLLRVHQPQTYGDRIDRFTAVQAEKTGKTASGVELGLFGTFTLRVVRPVFDGKTLVGYVELGKEIEDVLVTLHKQIKVELVASINKKFLDRARWEEGMKMLGRTGDWNRFADEVEIYSSLSPLPPEVERFVGNSERMRGDEITEAEFGGVTWRIMSLTLNDASGKAIGNLLVLRNISAEKAEHYRMLAVATVSGVLLAAGLFGFLFTLLRRTDTSIIAQQSAIRESEARFRELSEHTRTVTWEVNAEGLYTYVSDAAQDVLGYHPDELTGKMRFYDLHPQSGREEFKAASFDVFDMKIPFVNMVNPVQTKDGRILWVATNGFPMLNRDGTLRGYRGNDIDITERKLAEDNLRESEARFRSYFELPLVGIAITSPEKGWLSVNDSLCEMLGYSEQELSKLTWAELTHPDDLNADTKLFNRMLAGELEKYGLEKRFIRKDGSVVWVNLSVGCVRKSDGKVDYVVALLQNVTERKHAESELHLNSQMQKRLINISSKYINLRLEEVSPAIQVSLRELGELIGADRAYVFTYDFHNQTCSNKYEWCAKGIIPHIDDLQNVPLDRVQDWVNIHRQGKPVHVPNVQELPPCALREILEPLDVKSLLMVPMMNGNECVGFVGFDSVRQYHFYTENETNFLTVFAQMLLNLWQRTAAEADLIHARKRELGIGFEIQNQLLLGHAPENLEGAQVAAFSLPSRNIDGDFYDFIQYDNHHFDLFIGDVMGKGVPAALCGAATKAQFLRAIYDLMCSNTLATLPTLEEIVSYAHSQLCEKLIKLESFVTACVARFNLKHMRMDIIDGGHPSTIHFHQDSGVCDLIKGTNCPIGFNINEVYEQQSVHFKIGDIICFYSDGVIELQNGKKEFFGITRLTDFIINHSSLTAAELSTALGKRLHDFSESKYNDDITFIFVKIEDVVNQKRLHHREATFTSSPESVHTIRTFVQRTMEELSTADAKVILMLELGISEVVANIIKHAYDNQHDKQIITRIDIYANKAEVSLCHSGSPMEKRQFATPAFDGSHDNGYGLYFIRNSVDSIELGVDDDGMTCIKLTKKFGCEKRNGKRVKSF